MSTEASKPAVTRAGKKPEIKATEKKKFFSRTKKSNPKPLTSDKQASLSDKTQKNSESHRTRVSKSTRRHRLAAKNSKRPVVGKSRLQPNRSLLLVLLVVLGLLTVSYGIVSRRGNNSIGFTSSSSSDVGLLGESSQVTGIGERPEFRVLLVKGVASESQQYDAEIGVFFFRDQLSGAIIRVNQQVIPPQLATLPNGVKNLALSKGDVDGIVQLDTNKGAVYLGNLTSGGQVAIFDFDNLLLFIESTSIIAPDVWLEYIDSLSY